MVIQWLYNQNYKWCSRIINHHFWEIITKSSSNHHESTGKLTRNPPFLRLLAAIPLTAPALLRHPHRARWAQGQLGRHAKGALLLALRNRATGEEPILWERAEGVCWENDGKILGFTHEMLEKDMRILENDEKSGDPR